MNNDTDLKTFLKKFTAINDKFIDEYYNFYELCYKQEFGINLDLVIEYLEIKLKKNFMERFLIKFLLVSIMFIFRI